MQHLLGLANGDRPIGHTEVGCDGSLSTNTASGSSLRAGLAVEDTDLKHTRNLVDLAGQLLDGPNAILTMHILASGDIGLDQQGRERSIDNEEALVGLEGAFLFACGNADEWVDTAEVLELEENAVGGDGGDFNGDGLPTREEAGLELAVI